MNGIRFVGRECQIRRVANHFAAVAYGNIAKFHPSTLRKADIRILVLPLLIKVNLHIAPAWRLHAAYYKPRVSIADFDVMVAHGRLIDHDADAILACVAVAELASGDGV